MLVGAPDEKLATGLEADVAAPERPSQQPTPTQSFSMTRTFAELPWHVVPFLFGMFALVESLQQGGWVDFFAGVRALPAPTKSIAYDLSV